MKPILCRTESSMPFPDDLGPPDFQTTAHSEYGNASFTNKAGHEVELVKSQPPPLCNVELTRWARYVQLYQSPVDQE